MTDDATTAGRADDTPVALTADAAAGVARPSLRIGLIGHPLVHSQSPVMQQAALDALGVPARYELWDTAPEELTAVVAALRQPGVLGANVTTPYKTAVMPLLDSVTPGAEREAGAVNTIVAVSQPDGSARLVGHNTDLAALSRLVEECGEWHSGQVALVLGAGGAAAAAVGAAWLRGMVPCVAARRIAQAKETLRALTERMQAPASALDTVLANDTAATSAATGESEASASSDRAKTGQADNPSRSGKHGKHGKKERRHQQQAETPTAVSAGCQSRAIDLADLDGLREVLAATKVLINATPVGTLDPDATPLPLDLLRVMPRGGVVIDMVYNPPETALVRAARAAGLRAAGGMWMLLYQGAAAFTLWTQRPAPLEVMRAALEQPVTAGEHA